MIVLATIYMIEERSPDEEEEEENHRKCCQKTFVSFGMNKTYQSYMKN